jgi:hypothetical protein
MHLNNGFAVRLGALALLVAVTGGCGVSVPRQESKWTALLEEVRAFERRMGFRKTGNFLDLSKEEEATSICGRASRFYLPYSYQDPAIQWRESVTEEECRKRSEGFDIYYTTVEAWGEIGTPVTPAMLDGKLDRFFYLVIHEDCHDQFDLPYGVEEALCNVIAYKAMPVFSRERYGANSREHKAVSEYASRQEALTRGTNASYEQLEKLYGRYGRKEVSAEQLLRERAALFRKAEKALAWRRGALNNVSLANDMTYSRHYPLIESAYNALGRDLERTVALFRRVDETKPSRQAVMKRHRLTDEKSVELIRAYEAEVVKTIERALAEAMKKR